MFDLFDSEGKLVPPDTIDPKEVEALPEAERSALMAVISASTAHEIGEARYSKARKSVASLMVARDIAQNVYDLKHPAQHQVDALRAVIRAQQPDYVPEPVTIDRASAATLAKATKALAESRVEFAASEAASRTLAKAKGDAIALYMSFRAPVTAEAVHRAMMDADNARKVERVQRGEPPMPLTPPPRFQSRLDQVMSGTRERGNKRVVRQPR